MKPIKPENVNEEVWHICLFIYYTIKDFERVIQQEAQKRLSGQTINGDMLNKLAKILNLTPNNHAEQDLPMTRDNLDFVFQNAMMNG